jgi:hypothetical protein
MVESSRDGLGTTRNQPYAQSTYLTCNMCIVSYISDSCDRELCLTVSICFRRINHMAVRNPFAFILWCTRSCVGSIRWSINCTLVIGLHKVLHTLAKKANLKNTRSQSRAFNTQLSLLNILFFCSYYN